ncbi:MAG: hypothetical protein HRT64_10850, partial [Erythrobacter sp.]|nr:hypothetical protein [Erythrobacter sp.]
MTLIGSSAGTAGAGAAALAGTPPPRQAALHHFAKRHGCGHARARAPPDAAIASSSETAALKVA